MRGRRRPDCSASPGHQPSRGSWSWRSLVRSAASPEGPGLSPRPPSPQRSHCSRGLQPALAALGSGRERRSLGPMEAMTELKWAGFGLDRGERCERQDRWDCAQVCQGGAGQGSASVGFRSVCDCHFCLSIRR